MWSKIKDSKDPDKWNEFGKSARGNRREWNGENTGLQSETFQAPTRPASPDELFVCFSKFTSGPRPRATEPSYISGWKPANEIRETLQLPSQTIFRGARTRENGYLQPIIVKGQPRREKKIHNVREPPLDDTRRRHEGKGNFENALLYNS